MASRRAYADEYAVRVNQAVELLVDRSPADAVRTLQDEHALSERQARRYVNAARAAPDGVAVPERTADSQAVRYYIHSVKETPTQ